MYRRDLVCGSLPVWYAAMYMQMQGKGNLPRTWFFGGHNLIAENGTVLQESKRFENQIIYGDLDMEKLAAERRRMTTFVSRGREDYVTVPFEFGIIREQLCRFIDPAPFVPSDPSQREKRCEEILKIQAMGLKKRLEHTGAAAVW